VAAHGLPASAVQRREGVLDTQLEQDEVSVVGERRSGIGDLAQYATILHS
jgi:hypothetical protein